MSGNLVESKSRTNPDIPRAGRCGKAHSGGAGGAGGAGRGEARRRRAARSGTGAGRCAQDSKEPKTTVLDDSSGDTNKRNSLETETRNMMGG